MRLPRGMRVWPGPFGLSVIQADRPVTPHVLLPEYFDRVHVFAATLDISIEQASLMLGTPAPQPADAPGDLTLAQLREVKEREALRSPQPAGWGDRTYQSVTGIRWRCCGNSFDDDHAPWCPASGFLDPLPDV